jgi:TetR/AcrR family transcriptional regulator, multidrug resistance operon repressor
LRTRNSSKEKLVRQKAIELLVEEGFQGFSMNKLARACSISVATLYIYYRDKEDMIIKIGTAIGKEFMATTLKGFSPKMHFAEGLKKQWENRSAFALKHPKEVAFYEIIRHATHGDFMLEKTMKEFKATMEEFSHNAIKNKELIPLSIEVFWTVAYGPLYSLLRFHHEGKSIGGKPFKFSKQKMYEALELVVKALTP